MEEIDICRAANIMVQRHRTMAEMICQIRAETMTKRGDADGRTVWLRIMMAVKALGKVSDETGKQAQ